MPEGPEIRRAADRLAAAVAGQPLLRARFAFPALKRFELIQREYANLGLDYKTNRFIEETKLRIREDADRKAKEVQKAEEARKAKEAKDAKKAPQKAPEKSPVPGNSPPQETGK